MRHLVVFGDVFDLTERATTRFGAVRVTAFVQRSRLAGSEGVDSVHAVIALPDDASTEEWTAVVHAVHAAHPITHAAALVDHLAVVAATAVAGLGVDFHDADTLHTVGDKAATRDALDRHGLYAVPHRVVVDADEALVAAKDIGLPCVVKPLSATGSVGVGVVRDPDEVTAAYLRAADGARTVLIERFLAGPQYSVEAMSEDGVHAVLAVTRKYSDPESLVELGHVLPALLDEAQHAAIAGCAGAVLDAVGLTYGPSHTEVILTSDGPMPIETHARVGGDDIWLMVHAATGVDLDTVQADQILGDTVLPGIRTVLHEWAPERRFQAVWFGAAHTEGVFAGLTIPPEIDACDHVVVSALVKGGAAVRPPTSSNDRVFKVRATGTSADEALELARSTAEAVAVASGLAVHLTRLTSLF
jgi:biotin carboxylase